MTSDYFLARKPSGLSDGFDSPTSPTGTQPRSNPLASKVTSVLSASYADSDIRDALTLLDKRNTQNNAETRRQLRLDVQKEVLESNGDIIREFGQVAEQLKRIGLTIASLNQGCEEMKRHIMAAHLETAPVLEEASELMKQKDQVENKQQLLKAFNAHFIMSDDDIATLTSTAEPVNDKFFSILARAKKIQTDCEILLGTENQRLGLEIMEQVSKNLNGAFQKLYRWIQREFKSLNLENPQISSSIRRALRVLAERPSLFQNCLDFFAEAREHILSDSFYTALTGSSVNGEENASTKPIELAAHDPLRYVGDMLAWTHSATVSEREALEVLFISDGDEIAKGIQAGRDSEPWNRVGVDEDEENSSFDGLKALNELVDRDVAGVARVLRQRIGQVIQSHEETITAYKIANLLNFYRVTFSKLLGDESVLLESLSTLEESALRQFRILMRDHVASLQNDTQLPPNNLHPPEFLQEGLKQLTAIMKTYETSFTSPDSREADFRPILTEAFDPFMTGAQNLAKNLPAPSDAIFSINCLLCARSTLAPFDFTVSRIEEIDESIEKYSTILTKSQYAFFLTSSALQPLIQALDPLDTSKDDLRSIRTLEAFQPAALSQAGQILDDFLPSALMDATENLKKLQSSKLVAEITEKAAEKFCDDFEEVEEKLNAADEIWEEEGEEGEEPLRALFPRTSGEIKVLLS
ncbi:Golgi transport complex subunit 6 [Cadophora gregata]|uniref:Golgi transport complex subunit 6 n=1 Tax=Cadophora gregata TaxID=51156 RepID=UPI0026DBA809|nr:Golgi transport complex subunit 6 [Cadophora gregata]KAK0113826.1 Golgi transport complex subunit 6 [Cadophora gregata f. sp. sojae]KAK0114587.1 Golgi transport complex subunit 6 [Cadophora gregata]